MTEPPPATYAIPEPRDNPQPPKPSVSAGQLAVTVFGILLALAVSGFALIHSTEPSPGSTFQEKQIQNLETANTRLAGELAGLSNQQTHLSSTLASVTSPSPLLITCGDLRRVRLTVTTGGSIEAGGVVGLTQDTVPFPLPAHCPK